MGGSTTPAPGGIDLHEEVALSDLKVEVTLTPHLEEHGQRLLRGLEAATNKMLDAAGVSLDAEKNEDEGDDTASGHIDYATFCRTDLRTGTVTKAEWVPKSDKLLKLEVDFGELGARTILAGIAQSYTVEAIVGFPIIAVVNLPPRKMMGQESHGMLLAAKAADGKVLLAGCPGVPNGSKLA